MKLNTNRFALFPVMCRDCKRYIWLEGYRSCEIWNGFQYQKSKLCKTCVLTYLLEKTRSKTE